MPDPVQPYGDNVPSEETYPLVVRKRDALQPGRRFEQVPHPPEDRGKRWNLIRAQDDGRLIVTRTTPVGDDPELLNLWYRAVDFLNLG